MTVYELVELLKQFAPDTQVFVAGSEYDENGLTTPVVRSYDADDSTNGNPFVEIG